MKDHVCRPHDMNAENNHKGLVSDVSLPPLLFPIVVDNPMLLLFEYVLH